LLTSLIDVQGKDSSLMPYLFVRNPSDISAYAALSYCWGKSQNNLLTKAILANKINPIPIKDLAQTIQDAVVNTKMLGLRYLLVDALCIVQNSKEDWALESSNMGKSRTALLSPSRRPHLTQANGLCLQSH
jgi:hypothetical protein